MKVLVALSLFVVAVVAGVRPIHPRIELLPLAQQEDRITNGEIAKEGQFPYQVCLLLTIGSSGAWCGGTLVSDRWVVTAAHCTVDADSVIVYLGAHNIKLNDEEGQHRVRVSKSGIFTHEDYDAATITNDIALIKFPSPVEFNDRVQPAVLPKRSDSYSTYVGEPVVASGWGKDSDSATSVSEVLNYIETTVTSQKNCNYYYLGSIKSSMICINAKDGRSTCSGDSGGPLVHKEDGKNVLIGATSFGIAFGCEVGWPGVFTRITSFLDWIDAKTGLVE